MKTQEPKISVVVPAYNEAKHIQQCIKALIKQNTNLSYEIIIVDNASSDETPALVQNIAKGYPGKIKLITENRKGVGFARQAGFEHARAEIIASTDADTKVPAHWLDTIYQNMQRPNTVGIMGTFLFYDRGRVWNMLTVIVSIIFRRLDWIFGKGQNHFMGMNFAVKKSVFQKTGGFSTNLQYGEDIDFAKKARKFGRIHYVKKMRVLTHSRRYKPNLTFVKYVINFFTMGITGKPWRNELPMAKPSQYQKDREP